MAVNKNIRLDARKKRILKDMFERRLNKETMADIAKSHSISRETLSGWANSNEGKQLHAEFMKKNSEDSMPTFFMVLDSKVAKGNRDAMLLYSRIHGLIAPTKQEVKQTTKIEQSDIVKEGVSDDMFKEIDRLLKETDDTKHIRRIK